MNVWWQLLIVAIAVLAASTAVAIPYGAWRWRSRTARLYAQLEAARSPTRSPTVDFRELDGLPPPVERYFRAALTEGQPLIAAVSVEQTGTFNLGVGSGAGETKENWKPFTATQRVTTARPGCVWDARIRMAPGLSAFVWDAYITGEGVLTGKLLGLVTLMEERGTPELAEGEAKRFFGEAAWYPTVLLPSQGVRWEAVDDTSAMATLRDGEIEMTARFRFNEVGLIESFLMERGRLVAGRSVPTPWEGRFSSYERREGMLVPIEGEVRWLPPDGPSLPYWRGRITKLEYELTR